MSRLCLIAVAALAARQWRFESQVARLLAKRDDEVRAHFREQNRAMKKWARECVEEIEKAMNPRRTFYRGDDY